MVRLIDQSVPTAKQISTLNIWASKLTIGDRLAFMVAVDESSDQRAFQSVQLG